MKWHMWLVTRFSNRFWLVKIKLKDIIFIFSFNYDIQKRKKNFSIWLIFTKHDFSYLIDQWPLSKSYINLFDHPSFQISTYTFCLIINTDRIVLKNNLIIKNRKKKNFYSDTTKEIHCIVYPFDWFLWHNLIS